MMVALVLAELAGLTVGPQGIETAQEKDKQLDAGRRLACYDIFLDARSLRQAWRKEQSHIAAEHK
jgi:hypothetical protein